MNDTLNKQSKLFVAGEKTTAGKALLAYLNKSGYTRVYSDLANKIDLTSRLEVSRFFTETIPEYVFFMGASSAGISANRNFPADLSSQNLLAACHIFEASAQTKVKKILYLASSCVYPRMASQPMSPESLFSGPLEATSEAYATAKLAGLSLARAYRSQYAMSVITAIPSDIYGPEDGFDAENSHVVEALIRKIHDAKTRRQPSVVVWGSGKPVRDFIFTEDLAGACEFLMKHYDDSLPINISAQTPLSVSNLAAKIKEAVAFEGNFEYDTSKPDGTPVKTLDASSLLKLGWRPQVSITEGIRRTYEGFLKQCLLQV